MSKKKRPAPASAPEPEDEPGHSVQDIVTEGLMRQIPEDRDETATLESIEKRQEQAKKARQGQEAAYQASRAFDAGRQWTGGKRGEKP